MYHINILFYHNNKTFMRFLIIIYICHTSYRIHYIKEKHVT